VSEAARVALEGHAFLAGFPAEAVDRIAEIGEPVVFEPGVLVFREGRSADVVYLVTSGHVAIEVHAPDRGVIPVDTVGAGHILGLSWAAAPFRYQFDGRAVDKVEAIALDAAQLRVALAENPVLGFLFLDRLAAVVLERLQATRIRMLDLYGKSERA
jgi:CRP/FNR family transcriptional regulator, cyclic AMP receptor protein